VDGKKRGQKKALTLTSEDLAPFFQLFISLVLGFLVGLQRQWAKDPLAGIRTFSLIALLGTSCALLSDLFDVWPIVVGFVGTIAAMVAGRFTTDDKASEKEHSGLVSEFSMLLMFVIGVLVHSGPLWLPAALAGSLAFILQAKIELHGLAARFTEKEIKAIMQFVLISLVILPIVPDKGFGPYEVLNPRNIWMMVTLIVFISLLGYIIYKFFGKKAGVLLGGILGGIISSTATTLTYSRSSKAGEGNATQNALIILIAWTVLYVRVFVEIKVAAPSFNEAFMPLGIMFLVSVLSTAWLWKSAGRNHKGMPQQGNPTEIKTALIFGALYSVILVGTAYAKESFGSSGLMIVAVLSGFTDVDAITLSTSRLVDTGKLLPKDGWSVIVAAVVANHFFKGVLAGILGGKELFKNILFSWAVTLVAGLILLGL
jgi:uncharacterized membrane protein (DUF4010 family)